MIDNPYQDIPLAAVLRSPIVGLNEKELATIRLANKNSSYYEAFLIVGFNARYTVSETITNVC